MNLHKLGIAAALAAVAVYFTLSGSLLTDLGSRYVSDGGFLLEKIHPGSYLAIMSGLLCGLAGAHGLLGLKRLAVRQTGIVFFVCGIAFCLFFALAFTGTGAMIALIDTFLPAGMLALALCQADAGTLLRLRRLLQFCIVVNACLALGEAATQRHLIPVPDDVSFSGADFRPAALYDHPLTGAAATMLGWFLRPDPVRAPAASAVYRALIVTALVAFGERAPLALCLCAMAGGTAMRHARQVVARRIHLRDLFVLVAGPAAIIAIVAAVLVSGAGQRLEAHLYWDSSANVRLRAFNIFPMLTTPELLFGTRREDLMALIEPLRLAYHVAVIENFWLVMLITLGGICFPVFVVSLGALLRGIWKLGDGNGRGMVWTLLITASASNSLGRKSMLLAALVAGVFATGAPLAWRGHWRRTVLLKGITP